MRFQTHRGNRAPAINITSLIDVMFLLVIFVLLSAKFEPEGGIAVDLPQGKSREVPQTSTYKLTLTHTDVMYLQKEKVTLTELPEAIKRMRATLKDPTLVVAADKDVPWERIVVVTDIARQAGQAKVNFKIKP